MLIPRGARSARLGSRPGRRHNKPSEQPRARVYAMHAGWKRARERKRENFRISPFSPLIPLFSADQGIKVFGGFGGGLLPPRLARAMCICAVSSSAVRESFGLARAFFLFLHFGRGVMIVLASLARVVCAMGMGSVVSSGFSAAVMRSYCRVIFCWRRKTIRFSCIEIREMKDIWWMHDINSSTDIRGFFNPFWPYQSSHLVR